MAKMMLKEKGINIKVVTTLHGTDITLVGSHPSYKTAVEFSINNSDVVTSVSESLKQDTLRLFKITNEIKVVHNFIDTEKYDRESLNECQRIAVAKPEERILTHISNFRPVKRIEDVIKIFHSVKKVISAKLLMVGEGPDKRKAELLVKKLGISDSVIFLGNSHEIEKILCYTDIFLLPSKSESFGLSALEAMAANTAIISTNTGGLPEVNVHGVTGYLSHLGDVEDMSKNTLNILKDDLTLSRFKINAKNHTNKFRLENILPIYENIYSSVLEKVL
jgi:N-acetyl-alpha-D-glucosaminyl L-malate synthase BshA